MSDFYEIDFLPVHTSKSGDAITVRYQIGAQWCVHVVDGGFSTTAPDLAQHIKTHYQTTRINSMVVTHPDRDHAEGLAPILEEFQVDALWMLRPWKYATALLPAFARYSSAERLEARFREVFPFINALEGIALKKGVRIFDPFQGAQIGPFHVLSPTIALYFQLLIESDKTPQQAVETSGLFAALFKTAARLIRGAWGDEKFSTEETSSENEMSVIQYAVLNGQKILLTGDAGRQAMAIAADHAPLVGLVLPGIDKFQVPHHGGRRNLSSDLLDRWLGPRLPRLLPDGSEKFTAMISSAKEDEDHPRKAVVRALHHRGARIATTENGAFRTMMNAPPRENWTALPNLPYPDEQED